MKKLLLSGKYIKSLRLRTLPLSLSGVILGSLIAAADGFLSMAVFIFAVLTTLSLQILANLANELGDAQKGTDTAERLGPQYSVQSGAVSVDELRKLIEVFVGFSLCFGFALVWVAFGADWSAMASPSFYIMLSLGALAVAAALGYTLGKRPYGYMALGDLGVFLFFGLLSVMGSYFLMAKELHWSLILVASGCGFLSMAVLNLNNMRDMEQDRRTRLTIPIVIGLRNAKIYHTILVAGSQLLFLLFVINRNGNWTSFIFLIFVPLWVWHITEVWKREGESLDKLFPSLSFGALIQCIILGLFTFLF